MNRGNYENFLIRDSIPQVPEGAWCSQCERHVEDCVCEELCDHFRVLSGGSDAGQGSNTVRDVKKSGMGTDQRTNPSPAYHFRESVGSTGDGDVCFPALSPVPLQLDWPAWRLSFSAYGEHMGWEVPQ